MPWLDRLTGKCLTYYSWFISAYYWFILAIVSVIITALIATGLGSVWRKAWARFVGMGLCITGFALAVYLIFGVGTDAPFGGFVSWLGAFVFAVGAAIYIWGWRERLGSRAAKFIKPLRQSGVFGAAILVLCALAAGSFYFGSGSESGNPLAWTAILVVLEALVFVWSFTRFRREFGRT